MDRTAPWTMDHELLHQPSSLTKRRRLNTGSPLNEQQQRESRRSLLLRPVPRQRQILLLDLDCFYAQAMCRRYGLDATVTSLALLQWNSVLAVTYPARKLYGIRRGDTWEMVHQKSGGHCHAVHVPILSASDSDTGNNNSNNSSNSSNNNNNHAEINQDTPVVSSSALGVSSSASSLTDEYERFFCLTQEQQLFARQTELGVRKYSHQGKACIECFRIASARIFATVRSVLQTNVSLARHAILERASIDEFFLDVTMVDETTDTTESTRHTVVIGDTSRKSNQQIMMSCEESDVSLEDPSHKVSTDADQDDQQSLRQSCDIAYRIRQAVYDQLGFTMSAGIGTNKTLAKLAVTYGKPAGQAVCFPKAIPILLDDTPIKSCRNLGGKLGSAVKALLPPELPMTVGNIARYLSLPALQQGLGDLATAQRVFDIARGIDREPVECKTQTSAVLTKSITAFKSLNFAPPSVSKSVQSVNGMTGVVGHTLTEAGRWIQLLAHEVVTRVERDASRNDRYPRSCTIQYAAAPATNNHNKSIRIPFPSSRLTVQQRVEHLVLSVPPAIRSKIVGSDDMCNAVFRLHRIGLCATDFVSRTACSSNAIDSFFGPAAVIPLDNAASSDQSTTGITSAMTGRDRLSVKIQESVTRGSSCITPDADLEFAKQLQAAFDRENSLLTVLDKSSKTKASSQAKNPRIDRFFQKK